MAAEENAVYTVAELMALSARTAPKAKGTDAIVVRIVTGEDRLTLAGMMREYGEDIGYGFFSRDAENIEASDVVVIIGAIGRSVLGLDCGGCGYPTCKAMQDAQKMVAKAKKPFEGPNCVIRMADLGIAVGSAVKTASMHNVDNRIMFSAGVAALKLGWMEDCYTAYGIPLKGAGKNIFFDRK